MTVDFYKLLNVSRNATLNEVKTAYRRLALELHPDVNGGSATKTERFRAISTAHDILIDKEARAKHDRDLGLVRQPTGFKRPTNDPAYQYMRYRQTSSAEYVKPPQGIKFNLDEWNAAHYGDGVEVQPNVRQKNSWMDLKGSKHQSYYAKKAAREAHERRSAAEAVEAKQKEVEATEELRRSSAENLRHKREERRRSSSSSKVNRSSAATGSGDIGCSIS